MAVLRPDANAEAVERKGRAPPTEAGLLAARRSRQILAKSVCLNRAGRAASARSASRRMEGALGMRA